MRIEWDHVPEGEWRLEEWVTVIDGVALYVVKLSNTIHADSDYQYVWRNSYTGTRARTSATATLAEAMSAAIASLKGDDNND